ncbi:single-stranded-DNA-specific exonuclease RecJ [Ectothiorhodospiraceae bacterium 2226]|nr:single-stranded-DNA-specific exonuclease RecJ [Ectothiorhodospiraceae bacterium 2226]
MSSQSGMNEDPWHGVHPLLARLYRARGARPEDLDYRLARLPSYADLRGIHAAVAVLADALTRAERILVVGDFDADGATSCAVAVRGLRRLGAAAVDFLVPNRFEFGYGLTPEIVALAQQRGPDLLITVDNGISSVEGVRAARAAGIRVVVTDHHLPGEHLPEADAIVNPNQAGCGFPGKALAGVGVIFYVLLALRAHLRTQGWFGPSREEPNLAELLDLVALGTVADVVPLDALNRILVTQGLQRMRAGRACAGIRALAQIAGRDLREVVAADLGYGIAPRLNAAGRLDDMSLGVRCLLTDDPAEAAGYAATLDELNLERRALERRMHDEALALVEDALIDGADLPAGLCLFDPGWHQGVVGIVASRIKDRTQRPVIAFADCGDGELKGSGRSIPGVHLRDVLEAVATRHPTLLRRFGGHAMAAGLQLAAVDIERFSDAFVEAVAAACDAARLGMATATDGALAPDDLVLPIAELLRSAGPWGQGFPEPVFEGEFEVVTVRVVGEVHLKLVLRAPGGQRTVEGIAFNAAAEAAIAAGSRAQVHYRLDVNRYRDARTLQLVIERLLPLPLCVENA